MLSFSQKAQRNNFFSQQKSGLVKKIWFNSSVMGHHTSNQHAARKG